MRASVLAASAAAAALALTGCGGGGEAAGAAAPSAPPSSLAPLPIVKPSDMKPLVGRWVGAGGDYFQFAADGRAVWMRQKAKLWSGTVVPQGGGKYRFSWQGGDPRTESFWGVALDPGAKSLVFAATNQKYKKAVATKRAAQRGRG